MNITEIAEEMRTQDNMCTADPVFHVEEKVRDYGYDTQYSDGPNAWLFEDGEPIDEEHWPLIELADAQDFENVEIDEEVYSVEDLGQTGYADRWAFIHQFFTRKAADEYIALNKHRHSGELRVDCGSAHRNPEAKVIMAHLLAQKDGGWISVEDRLPEVGQEIVAKNDARRFVCVYESLTTSGYRYITRATYRVECATIHHGVTHWMPLPSGPEDGVS